jgi:hypothetical protein
MTLDAEHGIYHMSDDRLGGCFNSGRKPNPVLRHQHNVQQQC